MRQHPSQASSSPVLVPKPNHGSLRDDVRRLLDESPSPLAATQTEVGKQHGRIEARTSVASQEIACR